MELICNILYPNVTSVVTQIAGIKTLNASEVTHSPQNDTTGYDSSNFTLQKAHLDPWDFYDWNKHVTFPFLCVFGIIGNVLNFIILSKRTQEGVDSMERGALVSMMSLAMTDLLFCLVTLCGTNLHHTKMIYYSKNFAFYYILYSNCVQNILIKISTWYTVILTLGRYFVVCHPIAARHCLRCKHTILALLVSTIIWILLHIPLLYTWNVRTIRCPRKVIYLLSSGFYEESYAVKMTCIYAWFLVGFVVPVCVLGYCNIRLIYSLRLSKRLRSNMSVNRRESDRTVHESVKGKASGGSASQRRLTSTLIAIIIMFFVCFFPSEVIAFYEKLRKPQYTQLYRFMMEICNLLQAVNFSGNFVLYCIVNAYFRKTLKSWAKPLSFCCKQNTKSDVQFAERSRKQSRTSRTTKHSIISTSSHVCPDYV